MTSTDSRTVKAALPDRETIAAVLCSAARAPSVHNTQPWRWVSDGRLLHLYGESERQLFATDPHGRELTISCGAALHHARLAFAVRGWYSDIVRLPDRDRPMLLATLRFHAAAAASPEVLAQARAVEHRYSDRLPLLEPRGWAHLVPVLRQLVAQHDSTLTPLGPNARGTLTEISRRAATARRYDAMYGEEMDEWAGHTGVAEGIPFTALPSPAEQSHVGVARLFPAAAHSMRRAGLEDRARLAVLGSHDDTATEWLRTGEALSSVLLHCTAAGLATCALTHITELPATRRAVAELLPRHIVPQVVIRIGATPPGDQPPPQTPRRPLDDIFTTTD